MPECPQTVHDTQYRLLLHALSTLSGSFSCTFFSLPIPIYKHCLSKAKKGAKVSTTEERRRGERRHGERPHRKCRQKNLRLDSCFLPVK